VFVFGIALEQIARLIDLVAWLYTIVLIGRVICSWVNADPYHPIVRFIWIVTEPVLTRIRRVVPPIGGLDFSVLVALVIVQIGIQGFLVRILLRSAGQMQ
jgi:YggT family protein